MLASMPANLLYLAHRVPHPPDKGDRIRNWNVLRFLARRARVHLACLADEPVPAETRRVLTETCAELAIVPVGIGRRLRMLGGALIGRTFSEGAFSSPQLRRVIRDWTAQTKFDGVIVSASSLVPYVRQTPGVPAVVDLVDVDSQKWLDFAASSSFPKSLLYRIEGRRLRNLERDLPTWCKAVLVVSQAETELYRQFAKPGPIYTVTNGVDLDYFQPKDVPEELACTFVGALDYKPNVDGACWFAEAVWPELHKRRPELRFRLVGRQPAAEVKKLADIPGIEVVGQVPDVRPWVAKSRVMVVPLRIARGVQNKVLEALAMAKAVISSPAALNGLGVKAGEHLLSASSPQEWIEAILSLLDDEDLRRRLGQAGRAYVEAHHTWERCLRPLADILNLHLV